MAAPTPEILVYQLCDALKQQYNVQIQPLVRQALIAAFTAAIAAAKQEQRAIIDKAIDERGAEFETPDACYAVRQIRYAITKAIREQQS